MKYKSYSNSRPGQLFYFSVVVYDIAHKNVYIYYRTLKQVNLCIADNVFLPCLHWTRKLHWTYNVRYSNANLKFKQPGHELLFDLDFVDIIRATLNIEVMTRKNTKIIDHAVHIQSDATDSCQTTLEWEFKLSYATEENLFINDTIINISYQNDIILIKIVY